MVNYDPNKRFRDEQRRVLQQAGWYAVEGRKGNGAFKWVWIRPGRKKAYSREEAFAMAQRKTR